MASTNSVMTWDVETAPKDLTENQARLLEHKLRNLSVAEEKEAKRTNYRFLDPVYSKVISISMVHAKDYTKGLEEGNIREKILFSRTDEESLVRSFFAFNSNFTGRWVTYNGFGFDMPLMISKAIEYGVDIPQRFCQLARFRNDPHYDLMQVYSSWGQSKPSLEELLDLFGIQSSKEVKNGQSTTDFLLTATDEEIQFYNMEDSRREFELFLKMVKVIQ